MSKWASNDTTLLNGKDFNDVKNIIDKHKDLTYIQKITIALEISAFIGLKDLELQKRAVKYSKSNFDSMYPKVH
jgi:hypothetical protein